MKTRSFVGITGDSRIWVIDGTEHVGWLVDGKVVPLISVSETNDMLTETLKKPKPT